MILNGLNRANAPIKKYSSDAFKKKPNNENTSRQLSLKNISIIDNKSALAAKSYGRAFLGKSIVDYSKVYQASESIEWAPTLGNTRYHDVDNAVNILLDRFKAAENFSNEAIIKDLEAIWGFSEETPTSSTPHIRQSQPQPSDEYFIAGMAGVVIPIDPMAPQVSKFEGKPFAHIMKTVANHPFVTDYGHKGCLNFFESKAEEFLHGKTLELVASNPQYLDKLGKIVNDFVSEDYKQPMVELVKNFHRYKGHNSTTIIETLAPIVQQNIAISIALNGLVDKKDIPPKETVKSQVQKNLLDYLYSNWDKYTAGKVDSFGKQTAWIINSQAVKDYNIDAAGVTAQFLYDKFTDCASQKDAVRVDFIVKNDFIKQGNILPLLRVAQECTSARYHQVNPKCSKETDDFIFNIIMNNLFESGEKSQIENLATPDVLSHYYESASQKISKNLLTAFSKASLDKDTVKKDLSDVCLNYAKTVQQTIDLDNLGTVKEATKQFCETIETMGKEINSIYPYNYGKFLLYATEAFKEPFNNYIGLLDSPYVKDGFPLIEELKAANERVEIKDVITCNFEIGCAQTFLLKSFMKNLFDDYVSNQNRPEFPLRIKGHAAFVGNLLDEVNEAARKAGKPEVLLFTQNLMEEVVKKTYALKEPSRSKALDDFAKSNSKVLTTISRKIKEKIEEQQLSQFLNI